MIYNGYTEECKGAMFLSVCLFLFPEPLDCDFPQASAYIALKSHASMGLTYVSHYLQEGKSPLMLE